MGSSKFSSKRMWKHTRRQQYIHTQYIFLEKEVAKEKLIFCSHSEILKIAFCVFLPGDFCETPAQES